MTPECNAESFLFLSLGRREVVARFDGGTITYDAGALLFRETELTSFGAIIADHAKLGINASIPTGGVIGMGASISATRMLPKYLPSFAWVTENHIAPGDPLRALDVASAVMGRRDIDMTDEEVELFLDLGQRVQQFETRATSF
jgi:hypothetical protein